MSAFTSITAGGDWQDLAILNELVLAYSERRQAIGQSSVPALVAGDDVQALTLWTEMQEWLEEYCDQFVDDDVAIEGAAGVTMFTLATWRAAAGLDASGFRRATEWTPDATSPDWTVDPDFSLGVMQAGDIIGPWIVADLQEGFVALKWTKEAAGAADWKYKEADAQNTTDCATVRAAALAAWAAASETSGGGGGGDYVSFAWGYKSGGTTWIFGGLRMNIVSKLSPAVFRPCACDVYGMPEKYYTETFMDVDGLGLTEGALHLLDALAESSDATRETAEISGDTDCPIVGAGITCPVGTSYYGLAAEIKWIYWILKWNFTNA